MKTAFWFVGVEAIQHSAIMILLFMFGFTLLGMNACFSCGSLGTASRYYKRGFSRAAFSSRRAYHAATISVRYILHGEYIANQLHA